MAQFGMYMRMNNKTKYYHGKGFTLIELLLYIALATIIMGAASLIGASVLSSVVKREAVAEATYTMHSVDRVISSAMTNSVDIRIPLVGDVGDELQVYSNGDPSIITRVYLSGGALYVVAGSDTPERFTPNTVMVENIRFQLLSENPDTLSVSYDIYSGAGRAGAQYQFNRQVQSGYQIP